ncbi:MAG: YncE family protein, partial [Achromobacter sp.]
DSKHFMLNVALDSATQRLFATDSNTNRLYVFDLRTGKAVQQVPLGKGALDVRFNAVRQEIYVTNRGAGHGDKSGTGALAMLDANNYAVKRTVDLPVHPNSLALDDTGQVLFVTVKAPLDRNHPSYREGALDSVVRVPLNN